MLKAGGQVKFDSTTPQSALKYYASREFSKAAPLFKDVYSVTGNIYYFRYYIMSLTELQQFDQAESDLKKEIRKLKGQQPELLILYGYILNLQKRGEEAKLKFEEAIRSTPANYNNIINTANLFMEYREYELAESVYLQGQKVLPAQKFTLELALIHMLLRNYDKMMEELMDAVKLSEENLARVQSMLLSALYRDIEDGMRDEFRKMLLKRIQAEPAVIGYNRLMIWFFLQEKQFTAALRQSIALDRRTHKESQQILTFAQMALNNRFYEEATAAFDYILAKGKENPEYYQAFYYKLHAGYLSFTESESRDIVKGRSLATAFENGLNLLGFSTITLSLIREYAHLLSFYLEDHDKAIAIIDKGLKIPVLSLEQIGELKTELADIYVNSGDPWEATLLYSQVIDANRDNALGDEVKFKKARLGYFMGNFRWALAQLDVLKASTSKLTANDAMELSLFISNNSNQDSVEIPLHYFARADLLFFRNKDNEALATLDSVRTLFPVDLITDDILIRKAKISLRRNDYQEAIRLLDQVIENYAWDLLADDALFMEAEIYSDKLKDNAKAAELYKKILFEYSGSIYVSEARKRYRELTGNSKEKEPLPDNTGEKTFFDGKSNLGY